MAHSHPTKKYGLRPSKEEKTMRSETNQPEPMKQEDASNDPRTIEEKELDRVADEAAQRAEKREQQYDSEHDIFTK
jgi:hypothetical protein